MRPSEGRKLTFDPSVTDAIGCGNEDSDTTAGNGDWSKAMRSLDTSSASLSGV